MRLVDAVIAVAVVAMAAASVAVMRDPQLRDRFVQVRPTPATDAGAATVGTDGAVVVASAGGGVGPATPSPGVMPAGSATATATTTSPPGGASPVTPPPATPAPIAASSTTGPGTPAAQMPATTLSIPVQGITADQLVDTFGDVRSGERMHEALDIMAPAGTPVLAVADGHVEKLFDSARGGLTIYQFTPDGRHAYYYAHLQGYAPGLAEKQAVTRGQLLGYVGSTGNADPAAPHLHFAIFALGPEKRWWEGTPLNPYPLLKKRGRR